MHFTNVRLVTDTVNNNTPCLQHPAHHNRQAAVHMLSSLHQACMSNQLTN